MWAPGAAPANVILHPDIRLAGTVPGSHIGLTPSLAWLPHDNISTVSPTGETHHSCEGNALVYFSDSR